MRILITAGGTEEPIDRIRSITNSSTGVTGATIAKVFAENSHHVCLLHSKRADLSPLEDLEIEKRPYKSFADLAAALREQLREKKSFDVVVHLAAVSDYAVKTINVDGCPVTADRKGKIPSGRKVSLTMEATPKLIDSVKEWSSNPNILVVAFKLTDTADGPAQEREIMELMRRSVADMVVHNDYSQISTAAHKAAVWYRGGCIARTETKEELARTLYKLVCQIKPCAALQDDGR
ncbi:phosphopantothenoylcysteine decarboxylase [Marispirochaeta sp.]|uniref:phosphopantothenoylcysteine decarboxylase domain-containing protein n=1 Tax=Marispirochaeta sp. TaxID=2038653 RepID=UPI0029C8D0E2|nr:phosphopantothenoylcysteine decarboxylase [Marispirochaeta sp.]